MFIIKFFSDFCDSTFCKNEYCDKHIQWNILRPYLHDRPSQPWSEFSITDDYSDDKEEKEEKEKKEEKEEKKVKGGKSRRLFKKRNKTKKK